MARNRLRGVLAALLACTLMLALSACGAPEKPSEPEPAGPSKEQSESQGTADDALSYGHLAFTGRASDYMVIQDPDELATIVDPSAIPGESFDPYAVIMPADGTTSTVVIVLRSKDGVAIDDELIESAFTALTGNDLRQVIDLNDGSKLHLTYKPSSFGMSVATADEADGTLWVSAFRVADINAFLPLFIVEGTTPLRQLVVDGKAAGIARVGSPETGYVDVPDTWGPFTDADFPDLLQYSDPSGQNIITFNAYTPADLGIEVADMNEGAQILASNVLWTNEQDASVVSSEGYIDTVGGIDCYLVVAEYEDGSEFDIYCIPGEDSIIYIAIEGDPETVLEQGMRLRDSFSFEE